MGLRIPTGRRAKQLAIYLEQIVLAVRAAGFELEASELQVQRSNHSTTLPLYGKAGFISIAVSQKAKDINLLSAFQNERTSAVFLLNCQQRM